MPLTEEKQMANCLSSDIQMAIRNWMWSNWPPVLIL